MTKSLTSVLKPCLKASIAYSSSSSPTAINKNKFLTPGRLDTPYYSIKRRPLLPPQPLPHCTRQYHLQTLHKHSNTILSKYGKKHQILYDSKEGFRTSHQLQILTAAVEDVKVIHQDIYLLYIDFKNAFGSLDHPCLLTIVIDLEYLTNFVALTGNIYANFHPINTGEHFGQTNRISSNAAPL